MDTYKPLLTNQELKELCRIAYKNKATPLAQTQLAIKTIQQLRKQYRPEKSTVGARMEKRMAKQVAALKQAIEN